MVEQGEFTPDQRKEMWQDQIIEEQARFLERRPVSLEELYAEGLLIDPNPYSPSDILPQGNLRDTTAELLAPLSEVQRRVLEMDFGINTGIEKSRREIGEEIGRSKRAVSRIRGRALVKLRKEVLPEHLREHLQ
ncbi:hypothetical protein A3C59_01290 [Candidatus Daviesbacteria bacterium RIFCSPHIGHO2_02_FULL_36_13]|uniref:RNA polymerase sigma-70 region 4 domain-containing protein n=1 Tax=Candidatus Daviesbacteria bacterium RIFCSPHIGHO2_02_FULL_36_13 TaxID=1797768 RepID=A0A1F5JZ07_9BACT|nr:MAG: hypothetical protein A3C59_01290 [Candidatus Daviesbacteria bacterium RIFCSPHIGHO2_02_FULL_36_13]